MISITTQRFDLLKNIFNLTNILNDSCMIKFTKNYIEIHQYDRAGIRIVNIKIPKEEFIKYEFVPDSLPDNSEPAGHKEEPEEVIKIDTESFYKLLNQITKGLLKITKTTNDSITLINEIPPNKTISHSLKLFDLEEGDIFKMPKVTYEAEITTFTEEFKNNLDNLIFSKNNFSITITPKSYEIFDDKPKNLITLSSFIKTNAETNIVLNIIKPDTKKVTAKYNKELLSDVLNKLPNLSTRIKINFGDELPMLIESINMPVKIMFLIAPLSNEEDKTWNQLTAT